MNDEPVTAHVNRLRQIITGGGVPSSPASDIKCRQKTESLFAKAFKSLLQQNLPLGDKFRSRPQVIAASPQ
jgi:hypothetical protein